MPTSVTDIWPWWSQSVSRWCDILSPMIIPSLHSYAPWCPACQHLQNDWEGFAELSEALDISVGKVDVTRQPGMWKLSNTTIVTLTHYSAFVCACYCCGKRPGRACARMNPSAVVFTVFHIIQLCRQGHICKKDDNSAELQFLIVLSLLATLWPALSLGMSKYINTVSMWNGDG